jgi:beta-lactamase superfamily II metal-dependent hydrolase
MKIKIFQSGKGDCILINSGQVNILVDGGVSNAYTKFISKELNKLKKKKIAIDLACVSHIDDDHIGGFLQMIEDLVDWRVFDFQKANGNTVLQKPLSFRPPEIKEIWHNAFADVLENNAGEIEEMLAASADILSASSNPLLVEMGEIAFSKAQAIQLSRRLKPQQLNIPLNSFFDGKLAMCRQNMVPKTMGNLQITLIAPFKEDLEELRKEWNKWLEDNSAQVKKIRDKVDKDIDSLVTNTTPEIAFFEALADEWAPALLSQIDTAAKVLGKREKVTTPNLASIMFLVEEGDKTLLMTGDGHWQDILKGLKTTGKLDEQQGLHLDVLKVQHHGSEHNLSEDFCKLITATNYVFCGNGEHENPDLDVVKTIINSRTTDLAITAKAKNKFTMWFNCDSNADSNLAARAHMKELEMLLAESAGQFSNLRFKFLDTTKGYFNITV